MVHHHDAFLVFVIVDILYIYMKFHWQDYPITTDLNNSYFMYCLTGLEMGLGWTCLFFFTKNFFFLWFTWTSLHLYSSLKLILLYSYVSLCIL